MGLRRFFKNYFYRKKYQIKSLKIDNLRKKSIFITGTNSGIGLALVKKCISLDNKVYATYRKNCDQLKKIESKKLILIKCDNSNFIEIDNLKNFIKNKSINIIINNVGVWGQENQDNLENINYQNFINTAVTNAISVTKIVNVILQNSKKKSLECILNIGSGGGSISKNISGNAYVYRASKAMLNSLTKNMSIDLYNRHKIISFIVDPGNVKTSMNKNGILKTDDCAKSLIKILDQYSVKDNGKFFDLLKNEIPW